MTASVITPPTQLAAYEHGRYVGRIDRQFGIYNPLDFRAWLNVAGFFTGYDVGWTEQDRHSAEDVASMPDTPEEARFELEIDRAELAEVF